MNRVATIRLMKLFRELCGRSKGLSIYELAERLEVHYKTIYRDMEYLQMMDVKLIVEGRSSGTGFVHTYRVMDSKCPFCNCQPGGSK